MSLRCGCAFFLEKLAIIKCRLSLPEGVARHYDENKRKNLEEVLQSNNWWRVTETKVKEFEREFSKFQDCQYCLGDTNGTSALELALSVLNIGNGDEVIVPAVTFVSTGLAVINCNATPELVDIDKDTLCMLPEKFEQAITSKTKAVIPVHMGGNACYIEEICKIVKRYNTAIGKSFIA